jgi:hypothetical protein
LAGRKFSTLEEARKKAALARVSRIVGGVCRGMDLSKEIEIVDGLALGDTLLLERERDIVGLAVYHVPGVSEAHRRPVREVPRLAAQTPPEDSSFVGALEGRAGAGPGPDDPARLSSLLAGL